MSEKTRPSIISSEAYNRILATLKAHKVQEGQIDYCFEEVFVYGTEATNDEVTQK